MERINISGQPEKESREQRNSRFIEGQLTEQEIQDCKDRDEFLFEHEIAKWKENHEQLTKFRIWSLSEGSQEELLENVKNSWGELDFQDLRETLGLFFEQNKLDHPALLSAEYYVATDLDNKPFAITGIYTEDLLSGSGFATADKLNIDEHYLATRLAWFSVSKEYQGTGVGGFLFDWIEKMAKNRGSKFMLIETDNSENEKVAINLYESRGYEQGFDIKDYFGPGRDMINYFVKADNGKSFVPQEKIIVENKNELLELAQKIYSPERYQEFEACLGLFLEQKEGEVVVIDPHSFILRDELGEIKSFSIMTSGIYENVISSCWEGANPEINNSKKELAEALKGYAQLQQKGIVVLTREGEDGEFLDYGFQSTSDGVPEVFAKGDPTKFLLYSKKI
ncbi:MAG: GNAT family N-acetyltransferase [bacterium]